MDETIAVMSERKDEEGRMSGVGEGERGAGRCAPPLDSDVELLEPESYGDPGFDLMQPAVRLLADQEIEFTELWLNYEAAIDF